MAELSTAENGKVVAILNQILELELAGLVRYLHYSFMVFGHNRIPIVGWLRGQADESQAHAVQAGEHITNLGGHPSLRIGALLETHKHNVDEILREALEHEAEGLTEYRRLLDCRRRNSEISFSTTCWLAAAISGGNFNSFAPDVSASSRTISTPPGNSSRASASCRSWCSPPATPGSISSRRTFPTAISPCISPARATRPSACCA